MSSSPAPDEPSVAFDGPPDAPIAVVLGHGAGGGMDTDFMARAASGLASQGFLACRFNFPYVERGRKAPDPQPVLERTYAAAARQARSRLPDARIVVGGKSLGGRIASHVVASGEPAAGLVFLGYPLHPPGRPERVRAAHLERIRVPMLFVQGSRDPFCPLGTLEEVVAKLAADVEIAVVEDGDHSLRVRRASGRSTAQAWDEALDAVGSWIRGLGA